MNLSNFKRVILLGMTISTILFSSSTQVEASEGKKSVNDYFKEFPWIGLVANEITYGPITISHVNINHDKRLVFASPGEELDGHLKYKIHSKDLDSLHLYHLVVGIKEVGAQDCVAHSFGMWNSKGNGRFTLTAPQDPGVYEVCFLHTTNITCGGARDTWNSGEEEPSSAATIAIVIVE